MAIFWRKTRTSVESKIRAAERREHKLRETKFQKPAPPILIRLTTTVGVLPAGLVYQLPENIAHALVLRSLARFVVASFKAKPDLKLDEAELQDAGLIELLFPTWHRERAEKQIRAA